MSNQYTETTTSTISVPLGSSAHDWAAQQCQNISDQSTKNQMYATCLAIYAMHRYFAYLSIDSNLDDSFIDSHDLTLPGIGQLVCSWGDRHNSFGTLPSSEHQRIGRVALRMDGELSEIEEITELEILGFTQSLAPEISLADLASTKVLLEHLQRLEAQAASSRLGQLIDSLVQRVNLSPEQAAQKLEELYQGSTKKIIGSLTYAVTEWLDEILPQGLTQTLVLDRGLDSSTSTKSIDSIDDLALALAEAKLDAISLPVTAPVSNVSSLTTRILELLPWLSIERLTAKVDELVAEGRNTAASLSIWLEREFQGYSLAPVKSDDRHEEQDVTAPMSKEEVDAKIKELRKLSYKLVDVWK
jgi:polyhydroxyalkanoate synthesis regulator phasin